MKRLIKPLISVLLLAAIVVLTDFEKLKQTLLSIPLWLVAAVTVGYICGQFLSMTKWWLIARSGGIDVSWSHAARSYFSGMFVNSFGLGIVGGDVARALLLSYGIPKKAESIASVVADRAHGLAVLALIGTLSILCFGSGGVLEPALVWALALIGAALVTGWFIGPWAITKIVPESSRFRQKIERMAQAFPRTPRTIVTISIISAIFHSIQILLHGLMAYGLGANLGWSVLFAVVPFVNIASSLPISWNGLGVREASYSALLVPRGILSSEHAIAFGAIWLFAVTCASAVGGCIAILSGDLVRIRESKQESSSSAEESSPTAAPAR